MAYIRTPFATAGDRAAIPNDAQPDGSVSQTEGFPIDYQLDPGTDPSAKNVPRDKFNEIMHETQVAVQQMQQDGFAPHITASDNGGTPYAYRQNATCRATNGNNYYSLIDGNTDVPPSSNWGLVIYSESFKTGDVLPWLFSTIRAGGWLWMNGTTIGSAASGATQRANADTEALFTLLWNDFTNAVLPIQDSSGAASTRGVNAAADFAANKRLPVPDMRGRSIFGRDNMGGASAANRITVGLSAISGTTIGSSGGTEAVQLTSNQNGTHNHTATTASSGVHFHSGTTETAGEHTHSIGNGLVTEPFGAGNIVPSDRTFGTPVSTAAAGSHNHSFNTANSGAHTHAVTVDNSGLGAAHQNMPPAMIFGGIIIKI